MYVDFISAPRNNGEYRYSLSNVHLVERVINLFIIYLSPLTHTKASGSTNYPPLFCNKKFKCRQNYQLLSVPGSNNQ